MFTRNAFITNSSSSAYLYYGIIVDEEGADEKLAKWLWDHADGATKEEMLDYWHEDNNLFDPNNPGDWETLVDNAGGLDELFYNSNVDLGYSSHDWGNALYVDSLRFSTEGMEKIYLKPIVLKERHDELVRIAEELDLKDREPSWILEHYYG